MGLYIGLLELIWALRLSKESLSRPVEGPRLKECHLGWAITQQLLGGRRNVKLRVCFNIFKNNFFYLNKNMRIKFKICLIIFLYKILIKFFFKQIQT